MMPKNSEKQSDGKKASRQTGKYFLHRQLIIFSENSCFDQFGFRHRNLVPPSGLDQCCELRDQLGCGFQQGSTFTVQKVRKQLYCLMIEISACGKHSKLQEHCSPVNNMAIIFQLFVPSACLPKCLYNPQDGRDSILSEKSIVL